MPTQTGKHFHSGMSTVQIVSTTQRSRPLDEVNRYVRGARQINCSTMGRSSSESVFPLNFLKTAKF